jgi:hypothetical protein
MLGNIDTAFVNYNGRKIIFSTIYVFYVVLKVALNYFGNKVDINKNIKYKCLWDIKANN